MSSRFEVSEVPADEPASGDNGHSESQPGGRAEEAARERERVRQPAKVDYLSIDRNVAANQLTVTSVTSGNLALYEDELKSRPRIASLLSSLRPVDATSPNMAEGKGGKSKKKKKANLGTIMGVYLPTVQNILGVILFLRLSWIVGIAGVGMAFFIVFLCCCSTILTAISLSAIATNGHVPAGGAYFMISRNLGPEFGGAVGILFYLANTFGASLYIVGAIEILLTYVVPQAALFGNLMENPDILFNNIRIYGTILLILLSIVVFIGVKLVNWFGTFSLAVVIVAVVSIYAGAFNPQMRVNVCTVDGVAIRNEFSCGFNQSELTDFTVFDTVFNNSKMRTMVCSEFNPALRRAFSRTRFFDSLVNEANISPNSSDIFDGPPELVGNWTSPPTCMFGIPGITRSVTILENTPQHFLNEGEVRPGEQGVGLQISAEITTSVLVLLGIFYPSVTGIMAGSNRSGDLKDAQKSIPIGTIAAILTTAVIYLTCVLFFGATIQGFLLRDQFGGAAGLTVSLLAWPTKWVILIGALLSTTGAGLQALTGAPRLMYAIANDNLLWFLNIFKRTGLNGEPTFALILTTLLAEIGVLIASLDLVAPILTMFFLMCYMFVNFACFLQSILKAPNWRPRFRFYHWTTSLIGALLCLVLMFLVSWYYALVAIVIAAVIYKYIEYRGAEKEWGDGVSGLSLQAARYSLLQLEEKPLHTKNWRPQMLILVKLKDNLILSHPKALSFVSQLKAGKGLMMMFSVLEGKFMQSRAECIAAKQSLKRSAEDNKIRGFCQAVASRNLMDSISQIIQSAGLGGMKHNTILICWPDSWRKRTTWHVFIEAIRVASAKELAVLVPKGIDWFPSNLDRMKGNIDIWWVVHDGGLLMLLPFLLHQHKVWRQCKLRIFTVAQMEDNSIQMKKDLISFLYQLRIPAEVDVIEMPDNDISAYTYERTLIMEQRNEMLRNMRLSERQKKGDVQHLLSRSFSQRGFGNIQSPPADISIPVPRFPIPPTINEEKAAKDDAEEKVSIGELSIEPRVAGSYATALNPSTSSHHDTKSSPPQDSAKSGGGPILVQLEDFDTGDTRLASLLAVDPAFTESESGEESCSEEKAVRTPLLVQSETDAGGLPRMAQPAIRSYDKMFEVEEEEQLSGERSGGGGGGEEASSHHLLGAPSGPTPHEDNVRRMNTSVKLNELIVTKSHDSSLVIINLPGPPNNPNEEENYMEFLDVLTEGLERVLMVRGGGREVITIYS